MTLNSIDAITVSSILRAVGCFAILFFCQVILRQISEHVVDRSRKSTNLLLAIYLGGPALLFCITGDFPAVLLLLSICSAYLIGLNPSNGINSPSYVILRIIKSYQDKGGVGKEEILRLMEKKEIVKSKIDELANDGWIEASGDRIRLRGIGYVLGFIYHNYLRVMGLPKGG